MALRVGQDVIYRFKDGTERPAKIVAAWGETCANLVVFLDGKNDSRRELNGVALDKHAPGCTDMLTLWITSATMEGPDAVFDSGSVDAGDSAALASAITDASAKADVADERSAGLAVSVGQLSAALATASADLEETTSALSDTQATLATSNTNLTQAVADLAALSSLVTSLQASLGTVSADVATLKAAPHL